MRKEKGKVGVPKGSCGHRSGGICSESPRTGALGCKTSEWFVSAHPTANAHKSRARDGQINYAPQIHERNRV